MKWLASVLFFLLVFCSFGQEEETDMEETIKEVPTTMELGFDGYLGASNLGGAGGIGAKFGYKVNENFIMDRRLEFNELGQITLDKSLGTQFLEAVFGRMRVLEITFLLEQSLKC
jgi:hypothetical protein